VIDNIGDCTLAKSNHERQRWTAHAGFSSTNGSVSGSMSGSVAG
jgi:hypothetical protein